MRLRFRFAALALCVSLPACFSTCGNQQPEKASLANRPPASAAPKPVDASTLDGKLMMGYQGWFSAAGDGTPLNKWTHWSKAGDRMDASTINVDFWPDVSEFPKKELYATGLKYPDGSIAALFSSGHRETVARHVKWAADYGIDGFFLQRFVTETTWPDTFPFRNNIAGYLRDASQASGRVFAMMYDMAGSNPATFDEDIKKDWMYVVDNLKLTESASYLRHKGRPLLAIWGIGFNHIGAEPDKVSQLIQWLTRTAPEKYRVTLMGGVPEAWRTLTGASHTDSRWAGIYRKLNVISPWTVGRYSNETEIRNFRRNFIEPDLEECGKFGIDYLPVVFPGFSWKNLQGGQNRLNQIPRSGGRFWWKQAYEYIDAGSTMLYGAMFDEVDEGTAMFKLAADKSRAPAGVSTVTLDADGEKLPSDWYLRLAGEGARMLRGEIPLSDQIPISP